MCSDYAIYTTVLLLSFKCLQHFFTACRKAKLTKFAFKMFGNALYNLHATLLGSILLTIGLQFFTYDVTHKILLL